MTKEEFITCIHKDILDEAEDYEKYIGLAMQWPEYEKIFRDIAEDEKKHHEHLVTILGDMAKKAGEHK